MRVLQIIPSVSLVYGGPSQMVLGYSKALAAEGAEVTILTTDSNGDAGQPPLEVPLNVPIERDGYTIRYFRCAPFRRYKFSSGLLTWLAQHASRYDIAHIHALFSPVSSMAATIARWQGLPYILRPLGTLDPADLQKKKQLKQLYATVLERANLSGAAAIHFTSDQEAKISERFGAPTTDIILPLGVEPPSFSASPTFHASATLLSTSPDASLHPSTPPPPPHLIPTLLFMSRIDPKKGLDLLIPALTTLHQEGVLFRFVIAGSNPQDPNYEQQIGDRIRSSVLSECTQIIGFVTGEAKAALLQQTDVFVLPSYYENFGIAVAEAMAAGIPVVISDQVHICPDVQKGNAGWVSRCDVDDLTHHLREALTHPKQRQQRGLHAQQWAIEHYSWQAIARQSIKIYHQICASAAS
ncbi:MAG: hormogonium polysaccharide biosynthesis glycosyltransferase HpsP [Cyanobacteria bacterium P01_E01_bin.6]